MAKGTVSSRWAEYCCRNLFMSKPLWCSYHINMNCHFSHSLLPTNYTICLVTFQQLIQHELYLQLLYISNYISHYMQLTNVTRNSLTAVVYPQRLAERPVSLTLDTADWGLSDTSGASPSPQWPQWPERLVRSCHQIHQILGIPRCTLRQTTKIQQNIQY